jgi:hypothetical protein
VVIEGRREINSGIKLERTLAKDQTRQKYSLPVANKVWKDHVRRI